MNLPTPTRVYDLQDQSMTREAIKREIDKCLRRDEDTILPNNIRLVLTSPNGTKYALSVSNAGVLSAVAYP